MNEYQNQGAHNGASHAFNQPTNAGNASGSLITPELLHSFVVEVKGYLPRLEAGVTEFFQQPTAMERLAEAHGYAHTIKKAAHVIGLTPLGNIAERLQLLLEKLAIGGLPLDMPTYQAFQQIVAQVGIYLDHSAVGGALPPTALVEAIYALEHYGSVPAPDPVVVVSTPVAPEPTMPPQIYVLSEEYGEVAEPASEATADDEPQYFPEPTINARNSGRLNIPAVALEAYEAQPIKADLPPVYVLTPRYDAAHLDESETITSASVEDVAAAPMSESPTPPTQTMDAAEQQPDWWSQSYVQEAAQASPTAVTMHLDPSLSETGQTYAPAQVDDWSPAAQVNSLAVNDWPPADWPMYQPIESEAQAVQNDDSAIASAMSEAMTEAWPPVTMDEPLVQELRTTAELPAIHLPLGALAEYVETPLSVSVETAVSETPESQSMLEPEPEVAAIPLPPPAPPVHPPVFRKTGFYDAVAPHWQVVSQDETPTQKLPPALLEVADTVFSELPIEPIFSTFEDHSRADLANVLVGNETEDPSSATSTESRFTSRLAERLNENFALEGPVTADQAAFWMSASDSLLASSPPRSDWATRYAQPEARSANSPAESEEALASEPEMTSAFVPEVVPEVGIAAIPEPQGQEAEALPATMAPFVAGGLVSAGGNVESEKFISWEGEERARTSFDAATVWGPRPSANLPLDPALPNIAPPAASFANRDPFSALLDQLMPQTDPRIPAKLDPFASLMAEEEEEEEPMQVQPSPLLGADDFSDFDMEASNAPNVPVANDSSTDWDVPAELLEVFLPEAEEHLAMITTSLPKLAGQPDNKALLQEIRRSSHSLKGSSAVVGFHGITKLSHRMEDLLDLLYDGELTLTPEMLDLLFSSTEALDNLLNSKSEPEMIDSLYAGYDRLLAGNAVSKTAAPLVIEEYEPIVNESAAEFESVFTAPSFDPANALSQLPSLTAEPPEIMAPLAPVADIEAPQSSAIFTEPAMPLTPASVVMPAAEESKDSQWSIISRGNYVRVPIERLDSVVKLVTELIVNRATLEQNMGQYVRQLEELRSNAQRLTRVADRMEVQYEASTLGSGLQAAKAGGVFVNALTKKGTTGISGLTSKMASPVVTSHTYGFDALEFDRYTEFHLLLRELTECAGDMQTMERELRTIREYFESALNRQGRLNSEMQDQLMRLRMIPLASLSSRLHRTAHQVAQQRNKQVNFIIEGEDTRLDKTVIEEISDPLVHILRNAIDHGIETAAARQLSGKAPTGTVRLRAFHEGTQTVIQIIDDGAGLHPERLRAKAIQSGVVSPTDAGKLTEEELFALIFLPGFSTAAEVSEISGRGVGMDIVKTTIHRLKGRIDLDSKVGKGTTFTIRLPMTLAVMRALLVKAHKQTFAIPPVGLQQIVKLTPDMLDRVGEQQVIRVNNKLIPLMQLGRLLNLKRSASRAEGAQLALIMSLEERHFAIAVDETLGGRDVVVKNLGNHIREVRGITGTTLMGDGSAVLILNLPELIRDSLRPALAHNARLTGQPNVVPRQRVRLPVEQRGPLNIMVVDDSLSVRRVLANRLNAVGWKPIQAKDGFDALEQLQHNPRLPDTILLDIEMPRMDGYEFLNALRKNPEYANIPVVIITSRAGQKHRDRAFEVGANEYLVKPYQDDELLTLIRRLAQVTE